MLLWSSTVLADAPVRCEAILIGPTKRCGLQGDWAATGTGAKEEPARQSAIERLEQAVRHAAILDQHRRPMGGTDPVMCVEEVQKNARLTCFEEPSLRQKQRCYIDLPVADCGGLPMFELSGVGWRVSEKGRDRMCRDVDARLKHADAVSRARCLSRCAQDVRVRCPKK